MFDMLRGDGANGISLLDLDTHCSEFRTLIKVFLLTFGPISGCAILLEIYIPADLHTGENLRPLLVSVY